MKKFFMLLLAANTCCNYSFARILRVGYSGIPLSGTDYSSFQVAHDAANAGDTLHLFPGSWTGNVQKRLVFIGKGYLTEGTGSNLNLQNISGNVSINFNLYSGSDSSIIIGVSDGNILPYYNNTVNNIKIRRCRLANIYFNDKISNNWEISQSIIYGNLLYYWGGGLTTNLFVSNCYINRVNFGSSGGAGASGLFANNIFAGNTSHLLNNAAFVFQSNIFIGTSTSFQESINCLFQNNLAEATSLLPASEGNINGVDMGNTFVGYPTQGSFSDDARFQLKSGSPAIDAGYNGEDAGIFGGNNPYKLSGIPPIPSIYKLTAPTTVANSNPYTITISVKSNN